MSHSRIVLAGDRIGRGRHSHSGGTRRRAAMTVMHRRIFRLIVWPRRLRPVAWLAVSPLLAHRPQSHPSIRALFKELRWRNIGPFRGGRTKAVDGIPSQPNVFYIGAVNGGVWKTNDYGRTWRPLFDDQPTGSIGAIAIAPSDPNIVYVGSGEGMQRPDLSVGDGIYKSTDAGNTWVHLGCAMANRFHRSSSIPRIPIACSWRCWAIPMARIPSAACFDRSTAVAPS
jgi:hypothetical protein